MSQPPSSSPLPYRAPASGPPPPLVALVGWLLPGAGYWLLGQWARGLVVGVTVLALFVGGLLVGGVRTVEAPPWETGQRIPISLRALAAEPWFAAQVLIGPVGLGAAWASRWAAKPADASDGYGPPRGEVSHAKLNEIAVLYTAVAGLLNLLALIDAAHRAGRFESPVADAAARASIDLPGGSSRTQTL